MCVAVYALQDGATPLYVASEKGHLQAMKLLLNANANVDSAREVCLRCFLALPAAVWWVLG